MLCKSRGIPVMSGLCKRSGSCSPMRLEPRCCGGDAQGPDQSPYRRVALVSAKQKTAAKYTMGIERGKKILLEVDFLTCGASPTPRVICKSNWVLNLR